MSGMTNIAKPTPEMIDHILRYGGKCRDCADNFGICEHSKMPCDPDEARKVIAHVLEAREHFVRRLSAPQEPDVLRALIERGTKIACQDCHEWAQWQDDALAILSAQEPVADDDAKRRHAELWHWFAQKLNPQQRMDFLFAAGIAPRTCDFTLEMQHKAIRIIADRLQAKR